VQKSVVSIESFGGVGNGTTDDTVAFAAAVAYSVANSTCVLLTTGKNYIVGPTGIAGCFIGQDQNLVTITQKAGSSGGWLTANGAVGLYLKGFTLNGNASAVSSGDCLFVAGNWSLLTIDGVRITNCFFRNLQLAGANQDAINGTQSVIKNCRIDHSGASGYGLAIASANYLTIDHCTIDTNSSHGIAITDNGVTNPSAVIATFLTISNNSLINNGAYGLYCFSFNSGLGAFGPLAGPGPQGQNVVISGNNVTGNTGGGLGFDCQQGAITGNNIGSNTLDGILFNGIDTIFSGNNVHDNGSFGIDAGGCIRCKISQNVVARNSADSSAGINVGASVDTLVSDNQLIGNGGNSINAGIGDNGNCVGNPCTYSITGLSQITTRLTVTGNSMTLTSAPAVQRGIGIVSGSQAVLRNNICIIGSGLTDSAVSSCYQFLSNNVDSDNNQIIIATTQQSLVTEASAATTIIEDGGVDFSITGNTTITSLFTRSQSALTGKIAQITVTAGGAMAVSTTSLTIGVGAQSLTIGTGLSLTAGHAITIADSANYANTMTGTVTSYNSGTGALIVNITSITGSGTFATWTVGSPQDVTCALSGGGGANAAFYPNMNANGVVIACIPTANGSGYNSAPTVAIGGGGQSGATATAVLGVQNNMGRTIKLNFPTGLTINNGNNINLEGASNFAVPAGSWVVFKGDGAGNWNEVSR
jgi:hypothetical protein